LIDNRLTLAPSPHAVLKNLNESTFMNVYDFQNSTREEKKMLIASYSVEINFIPAYQ